MGIEFDSTRVDTSGVDDRRGRGGGVAVAGGGGIVAVIVAVVVALLGGDPGALPQLTTGGGGADQVSSGSAEEFAARCNADGALEQHTDCRLTKVVNVADDVWRDELGRRNLPWERPTLVFFTGRTQTGCGAASAQIGPFYCPPDRAIFFELGFLDQLQQQFGAQGEFAQAYIAAHEYGHHVQTLLGIEPKVRAAQQRDPAGANDYSIRMELQADCLAGVWARLADARDENGIGLTEANIAEAVNAAEAVGDDRIQQKVQGRVDPEGWTHGSAEQRRSWFLTGYRTGDLAQCDTFG